MTARDSPAAQTTHSDDPETFGMINRTLILYMYLQTYRYEQDEKYIIMF